jgi:hypothetical protein
MGHPVFSISLNSKDFHCCGYFCAFLYMSQLCHPTCPFMLGVWLNPSLVDYTPFLIGKTSPYSAWGMQSTKMESTIDQP